MTTIRQRFENDELTPEDEELILELLDKTDMMAQGIGDITALSAVSSIHRYGAIIYPNQYDGDTANAWLDQGFKEQDPKAKIRFWGIDTPEISKGSDSDRKKGRAVRDHVRDLLGGRGVVLVSHKVKRTDDGGAKLGTGKFGRYLMEVLALGEDGEPMNVNEYLVENGMAELNTYGDKFEGWAKP